MLHDAMAGLPENADAALSTLWQSVIANESTSVTRQQLHDVARKVGEGARAAALRPEELVLAIKDSWRTHHGELHRWTTRSPAEQVVSDVIAMSIEEFFSAQ